jgi:hypothetical protein
MNRARDRGGAGSSTRKIKGVKMRKAIPLLAAIAVALATAGVAVATRNGDATSYANNLENMENKAPFIGQWYWRIPHGPSCRGLGSPGFGSPISVSEEFKENVMNIAKSDQDVQNLLNAGYENTNIQPVIKATVQGNGDVDIKATGAIVTLRNNENRALVQVDLVAGKVTRIVQRTVIEKS